MAFFSGTDTSTLQAEGNDTNCFVSLIVDTKGTYQAAITRKVQRKTEVVTTHLGSSYEFFGDGAIKIGEDSMPEPTQTIYKEVIEYFMLDVQIEPVDNPLAYLDTRFEEIEAKKKKKRATIVPPAVKDSSNSNNITWLPNSSNKIVNPASRVFGNDFDEDYSFRDWMNQKDKEAKQLTLFSQEEMEDMVDETMWEPDPDVIHHLVCQMITCSLIVNQDIDLKKWINGWMDKKYKEIFGPDCNESTQFNEWRDFIVDFMINQYILITDDVPKRLYDEWDLLQSKIASAIYTELCQYDPDEKNMYIKDYMEVLTRYVYE